mmetsp:Transcript_1296/g.3157  ORF Transcript_1296/g.3157 Transcript_1296/m.3157 type:complete len:719 (+) Transcript_1296:162-2318(+)
MGVVGPIAGWCHLDLAGTLHVAAEEVARQRLDDGFPVREALDPEGLVDPVVVHLLQPAQRAELRTEIPLHDHPLLVLGQIDPVPVVLRPVGRRRTEPVVVPQSSPVRFAFLDLVDVPDDVMRRERRRNAVAAAAVLIGRRRAVLFRDDVGGMGRFEDPREEAHPSSETDLVPVRVDPALGFAREVRPGELVPEDHGVPDDAPREDGVPVKRQRVASSLRDVLLFLRPAGQFQELHAVRVVHPQLYRQPTGRVDVPASGHPDVHLVHQYDVRILQFGFRRDHVSEHVPVRPPLGVPPDHLQSRVVLAEGAPVRVYRVVDLDLVEVRDLARVLHLLPVSLLRQPLVPLTFRNVPVSNGEIHPGLVPVEPIDRRNFFFGDGVDGGERLRRRRGGELLRFLPVRKRELAGGDLPVPKLDVAIQLSGIHHLNGRGTERDRRDLAVPRQVLVPSGLRLRPAFATRNPPALALDVDPADLVSGFPHHGLSDREELVPAAASISSGEYHVLGTVDVEETRIPDRRAVVHRVAPFVERRVVTGDVRIAFLPHLVESRAIVNGHVDVVVPRVHPPVAFRAHRRSSVDDPPLHPPSELFRQLVPPRQRVVQAGLLHQPWSDVDGLRVAARVDVKIVILRHDGRIVRHDVQQSGGDVRRGFQLRQDLSAPRSSDNRRRGVVLERLRRRCFFFFRCKNDVVVLDRRRRRRRRRIPSACSCRACASWPTDPP